MASVMAGGARRRCAGVVARRQRDALRDVVWVHSCMHTAQYVGVCAARTKTQTPQITRMLAQRVSRQAGYATLAIELTLTSAVTLIDC